MVILGQAGIPDGLGGLGVECAGELGIPVQHAAGIAHLCLLYTSHISFLGFVELIVEQSYLLLHQIQKFLAHF